jgi:hypothetical protein
LDGFEIKSVGIFWFILQPFGIFHGYLLNFVVVCYIFPVFGMLYEEKSGNTVVSLT